MIRTSSGAGFGTSVVSEINLGRSCFQMIDYAWQAEAETFVSASENMLRWRLRPGSIDVEAWSEDCEQRRIGQLTLQPAGMSMRGRTHCRVDAVRALVFRFESRWFVDATGHLPATGAETLRASLDLVSPQINLSMQRLAHEIMQPGLGASFLAEGLAQCIAVDLLRWVETSMSPPVYGDQGLSPRQIHLLHEYLASISACFPEWGAMAEICGVRAGQLGRLYKLSTGRRLSDHIEDVRRGRAQSMLADTDLPLKVISYRLGYQNPSAFSNAFRRMTGETPRSYRRRARTASLR